MTTAQAGVLSHIRGLVAAEHKERLSDRQLLERFTAGEGPAFEALLRRHGPMVLGLCRRVLHDPHDAEDAFQATFLVLARSPAAIRKQDSLPSWLYGVAYRVAARARGQKSARRKYEQQAPPRPSPDALSEVTARELVAALDEELAHLPEKYRAPLLLCYLRGQTGDEAARSMGWSVRTLKRRLSQGREALRQRLARRGLTLPAALLTAGLAAGTAAAVPARLVRDTLESVLRQPAATGGAGALCGVLVAARVKLLTAAAVAACVVALALGSVLPQATAEQQPGVPGFPAAAPARQKKPEAAPEAGKKEIVAAGLVRDGEGKPIAGADVVLLGSSRAPAKAGRDYDTLAQGKSDAQGRFSLKRTGAALAEFYNVQVFATAKGHGPAWARLNRAAGRELELFLPPPRDVKLRLLDLQGIGAERVNLRVVYVGNESLEWLAKDLRPKLGGGPAEMMKGRLGFPGMGMRPNPRDSGGFEFDPAPAAAPPGWPGPLVAGKDGRLTLAGFGKGQIVLLLVDDERFARQELLVKLPEKGADEVSLSLSPAQYLEGRVTFEDTGKPAPGVWFYVHSFRRSERGFNETAGKTIVDKTDAEGRYRVNVYAGDNYELLCFGPKDMAYLGRMRRFDWPRGAVKQGVDVGLPRGVLLRGKVTERGSGDPIHEAKVFFVPQRGGETAVPAGAMLGSYWPARTAADGSYQFVAPTSPGHLLIEAPGKDWVPRTITSEELATGKPGGENRIYHDITPLSLKPQAEAKPMDLTVTRGVTVRGQILAADGKPVKGAMLLHAGELFGADQRHYTQTSAFPTDLARMPARWVAEGKFELRGCDPEKTYRLYALLSKGMGGVGGMIAGEHRVIQLHIAAQVKDGHFAASAEVQAGKAAKDGVTLKLAACGSVAMRLLDADGKPDPQLQPYLQLRVTPARGATPAEWTTFSVNIAPDAEGRITVPALIPGATYRLRLGRDREITSLPLEREFTAEGGKTVDLGDIKLPR